MPTWAETSFALVGQGGYLDRLVNIYPAPAPMPRPLTGAQHNKIRDALSQRDDDILLKTVLSLERFPFNDPYVSFLRQNPSEIAQNPQTVRRICERLRQLGLNGVVRGLKQPKELNRQMGPMFSKWLRSTYSFVDDPERFKKAKESLVFLSGGAEKLRRFANEIGCGLQKRPDFVAKARGRYVVGEAKFIGTEGGNQNRGFDDALALASRSFKEAVTAAILDGIVWIPNSGQMSKRLSNFSGNALTALLLDDFLAHL